MIRIEQSPEDVRLSFEFQMHSEIFVVRLASAILTRNAEFNALAEGNVLTSGIAFKPGDRTQLQEDRVTLSVNFDFRLWIGEQKGADGRELARIRCRFDADYQLHPGFAPSKAQIGAFHGGNAIFNCWPYFREFVQNTSVRAGLPPATVPFLRLLPKNPGKTIEAEATEALPHAEVSSPKRLPKPGRKRPERDTK